MNVSHRIQHKGQQTRTRRIDKPKADNSQWKQADETPQKLKKLVKQKQLTSFHLLHFQCEICIPTFSFLFLTLSIQYFEYLPVSTIYHWSLSHCYPIKLLDHLKA